MTKPKGNKIARDTQITRLVYADDQVLLAPTEDDLQRTVTGLNHILQLHNLQISEIKTKAMGIQGKYWRRVEIMINNKIIEQVSSITYLGNKVSNKIHAYLETQLCKYNNISGAIKRHFRSKMNTDILLRLHNPVSKSALHFGSETWILKKEDKRRLEASRMRFIRPIIGVTGRDTLTNEEIKNRLETTNIVNDIQSY
jgi:hypothetical protein